MMVYLCGGINGLGDRECKDWRELAKTWLTTETLDPMRRDYRGKESESVEAIVRGDLDDIAASDYILVNATRPSWGTAMEIVHAYRGEHAKIVAFVGFDAELSATGIETVPFAAHISPWLTYHCDEVFQTLKYACDYINADAAKTLPPREPLPRDPVSGRNFDGHYDDLMDCGCVHFYHGGVGKCAAHR